MEKDPRKKANLERTLEDHIALGSTPPKLLRDNPGKTHAELLSDDELQKWMVDEVAMIAEVHHGATAGDEQEKKALALGLRAYLIPNLAYLREIGRLPKEFEDLDPLTKFALPT